MNSFFIPGKLDRLQYLIRWLIWICVFLAGIGFVAFLEIHYGIHNYGWPLVIGVLLWCGIKLLWLDLPRLRDLDWSAWLLLLLLMPIAYAVLQILLFVCRGAEDGAGETPASFSEEQQKVPTFVYALGFLIFFGVQLVWAGKEAARMPNNPAFAMGYFQGSLLVPPVLAVAIASIWRVNRGFRGVVRVLCWFSLISILLGVSVIGEDALMRALPARNQPALAKAANPAIPIVLSAQDKAALLKEADAAQTAFNKRDVAAMLKHTPEVVFKMCGPADVGKALREDLDRFSGGKFLVTEYHEPQNAYQIGEHLVCFLPRTSILQIGARRIRSQAYWVAVRESGAWKFIDGAAFENDAHKLLILFPELPENIQIPEWKQEAAN